MSKLLTGSVELFSIPHHLSMCRLLKLTGLVSHQCIPVPDINKPQSTHSFAMTCIWIHLNRKAQNDNSKLQIPIPHSLKLHHECVPRTFVSSLVSFLAGSQSVPLWHPLSSSGSCSSRCATKPWACRTTRSPCSATPTAPTRSASRCPWASWWRPSTGTAP